MANGRDEAYTPTYILTWNPRKFHWEEYRDIFRRLKDGTATYRSDWSCRSNRPEAGDRFILLMQGMGDKNGIVGTGIFLGNPYQYGFDTEFGQKFVDIEFRVMWDYETCDYPKTAMLKEMFPDQCWIPQMSGIRIRSAVLPEFWKQMKSFISKL